MPVGHFKCGNFKVYTQAMERLPIDISEQQISVTLHAFSTCSTSNTVYILYANSHMCILATCAAPLR